MVGSTIVYGLGVGINGIGKVEKGWTGSCKGHRVRHPAELESRRARREMKSTGQPRVDQIRTVWYLKVCKLIVKGK